MPNSMDVQRLIAEVKKRPALWDVRLPEYKDRMQTVRLWQDIAENMGYDVEQCKRKWKNLRDAYRAEVRRTERRVLRLKMEGHSDPQVSDSKWVYFQPMSFVNESKRMRHSSSTMAPNEFLSDSQEAVEENAEMESFCDIKLEPHNSTDDEAIVGGDVVDETSLAEDDDEEANDMLFEQFKSVATPQAARRLSGTLSMGGGIGSMSPTTTTTPPPPSLAPTPHTLMMASTMPSLGNCGNGQILQSTTTTAAANTAAAANNCKCSQRAEDQVHFLEDLEREEQQLMQSTRRDITRNTSHHLSSPFGDPDYNFLVSFLPQMKRMTEIQNLQFRAKVSELMLRIMANPPPPAPVAAPPPAASSHSSSAAPTTFGCISTTTPCMTATSTSSAAAAAAQQHHQQL